MVLMPIQGSKLLQNVQFRFIFTPDAPEPMNQTISELLNELNRTYYALFGLQFMFGLVAGVENIKNNRLSVGILLYGKAFRKM